MEAARVFAERVMTQGGATPTQRLTYAFRLATSRQPRPTELQILLRNYNRSLAYYTAHKEEAQKLLTVGEWKANPNLDAPTVAAMTGVTSLILNLDEVISKE